MLCSPLVAAVLRFVGIPAHPEDDLAAVDVGWQRLMDCRRVSLELSEENRPGADPIVAEQELAVMHMPYRLEEDS